MIQNALTRYVKLSSHNEVSELLNFNFSFKSIVDVVVWWRLRGG